jgi:hypothetical protein
MLDRSFIWFLIASGGIVIIRSIDCFGSNEIWENRSVNCLVIAIE